MPTGNYVLLQQPVEYEFNLSPTQSMPCSSLEKFAEENLRFAPKLVAVWKQIAKKPLTTFAIFNMISHAKQNKFCKNTYFKLKYPTCWNLKGINRRKTIQLVGSLFKLSVKPNQATT